MPSAIRHFVIAFLIAALIFGIVGALAMGWFGKAVREMEKNRVTDDTETGVETNPNDEQGSSTVNPSLRGQSFSMLLILNDYQPDRYDYGYPDSYNGIVYPRLKKADTLVYFRFNRENATLYSAVIPSLSLVTVDGVEMTLAEAYHYKDAAYISDKVSALLGTRIDYYVCASYDEFVSFVNGPAVNGVTLEVPQEVTVTLRDGTSHNLQKGNQYLDGERILALLHVSTLDKKTLCDLQIKLAYALLEKLTTLENKQNPDKFYASVLAPLTTNLAESQLRANADMMFAYFDLTKKELTVPGEYDGEGNFAVDSTEAMSIFRVGAVLEQ